MAILDTEKGQKKLEEFWYRRTYGKVDTSKVNIAESLPAEQMARLQEQQQEGMPIYTWWRVDDVLADVLEEQGEPVARTDEQVYWGRSTFGQMCYMDNAIVEAFKELEQ